MSRVFIICLCDKFPTHCDCLAKADGVCVCVCVCVCVKKRESSEKIHLQQHGFLNFVV